MTLEQLETAVLLAGDSSGGKGGFGFVEGEESRGGLGGVF